MQQPLPFLLYPSCRPSKGIPHANLGSSEVENNLAQKKAFQKPLHTARPDIDKRTTRNQIICRVVVPSAARGALPQIHACSSSAGANTRAELLRVTFRRCLNGSLVPWNTSAGKVVQTSVKTSGAVPGHSSNRSGSSLCLKEFMNHNVTLSRCSGCKIQSCL